MVGGFFIIEAADKEEAVRVASLHPAATLGQTVGWGIEAHPIDFSEQEPGKNGLLFGSFSEVAGRHPERVVPTHSS
jgi:hypothetical protein